MASAVLASQNESNWGQTGGGGGGGGFMGKIPYNNLHLNPNPKKKQKKFNQNQQALNARHNDDSPVVTQTASDDAYSFNQRPSENHDARNGFNLGGYLTFNVSSYSKSELGDLRKRLASELEQIRNLRDRIESGQFSSTNPNPRSQAKSSKKISGSKRPVPSAFVKDPKKSWKSEIDSRSAYVNMEGLMKECKLILTKLMKHKNGWIFNVPVDAAALGLHDYHQIIKRPMDLGTVKSNLAKVNYYPSPAEFAADVRLTFNNALLYNPKTDAVHGMAEQLLARFEELFRPIQEKIDVLHGVDELQGSSWNHIPTPERVKKPKTKSSPVVAPLKKQERIQQIQKQHHNHSSASSPLNPPPPLPPPVMQVQSPPPVVPPEHSPAHTPSPPKAQPVEKPQVVGRVASTKLPKPRAKDPNKREMSMEEKHKLGVGLQSLPQEKMPQLVQIIRKRNEHLAQEGDEIELDIEALDTETLWELDRFVTNWKKMVSKTKRQALLMNLNPGVAAPSTSAAEVDGDTTLSEKNDSFKKQKKGEAGDEDVDIDDDMPATSFPPVEIEKDEAGAGGIDGNDEERNGNASSDSSSSSSSSSGSSSSSDSDSGSSSGSDSDEDDAQS